MKTILAAIIIAIFPAISFSQPAGAVRSISSVVPAASTKDPDYDFSTITQKLILKRETMDTYISAAKKTGVRGAYDVLYGGWYGRAKVYTTILNKSLKEKNEFELGEISLSKTAVCTSMNVKIGKLEAWHVSFPINIKPRWDTMKDYVDEVSQIRIEMQVLTKDGKSSINVKDILPNTLIVAEKFGGKVSITVGADGKWGPAQGDAKALFWWNWDPKTTVIDSAATGNQAYVNLYQKADKQWFGQVPIELSLLVPSSIKEAKIRTTIYVVFNEKINVPLSTVETSLVMEK